MNNTIQIDIPIASTQEGEILIAKLAEVNFYAFQEHQNILSAFIKEEHFEETSLSLNLSDSNAGYTKIVIPYTNWNQKWEDEFIPVIIDDFVAVRTPFNAPVKNVNYEIIITPKMSFGTGHHATTYLMLQQMKEINFYGKNIFDFGTGTGILAIMAKKLGASLITAIDNDDWSLINAKENFRNNRCEEISLFKKDSVNKLVIFDIILANINLNILTINIEGIKEVSNTGTKLLLSGILHSDFEKLMKVFADFFECERISEKDNWICVRMQRI